MSGVNPNVAGGPDPSAGQYGYIDPNTSAAVTIQKNQVGMTLDTLQTMFTQQQTQQGQSGVVNSNADRPVLDMTVAQAISTIQSQSGQGDQVSTFLSIVDELPDNEKTALLTALSTGNMQDPSMQALYTALQTGTGIISAVQNFSDMQPTSATQSANSTALQNVVSGANTAINTGLGMVAATETEVSNMTPAQLSAEGMTTQDQAGILDFLKAIGSALSAARQLLGQIATEDAQNQKELTDVEQAAGNKKMADAVNSINTIIAEEAAAAKERHIMGILGPIMAAVGAIVAIASIFDAGTTAGLGVTLMMMGIVGASIAMSIPQCPLSGMVSSGISSMISAMKSVMPSWAADVVIAAVIIAAVVALRNAGPADAIGSDVVDAVGEDAVEDAGEEIGDDEMVTMTANPLVEGSSESLGGGVEDGVSMTQNPMMEAGGEEVGDIPPPPSEEGDIPPPPSEEGDIPPPPSEEGDIPPPPSEEGDIPPPPNEPPPSEAEAASGTSSTSSTARSAAQKELIRKTALIVVVSQGANVLMASNAISDGTLALIKEIKGSTDADDQMIAMIVQTIVILVAAMAALSGGSGIQGASKAAGSAAGAAGADAEATGSAATSATEDASANLKALQNAAKAFQAGEGLMQIATGIYQGVVSIKQGQMEEQLAQLTADMTLLTVGNQITAQQISTIVQGDKAAGQTMDSLGPFFANIVKEDSQTMTTIARSVS